MSDYLSADELDFNEYLENLKTFLKNQPVYQDYNFEGSNLGVLLDLLAYNTYVNAFLLNMVGSEMHMSTAKLRNSVVQEAIKLNYLPRSYRSARALVQLTASVTDSSIGEIVVPRNTLFISQTANGSYSFLTDSPTILQRISNSQFQANCFIYEGSAITEKFEITTNASIQRAMISNPTVDTRSLAVTVQASTSNTANTLYTLADNLYGLHGNSTVYFLQPAADDRYEVVFGDDVFGKKPKVPNIISVNYRISRGTDGNGATRFRIQNYGNWPITVTTLQAASGGANNESIESIKFNAPRHFQTQYRAVNQGDYRTLLLGNFAELAAVHVFGGDQLANPQYGRVYVSAVPETGIALTNTNKQEIITFLNRRTPLTVNCVWIDPNLLDIVVQTTVTYNTALTDATENQIRNLVRATLSTYNTQNLNDFNITLRYSKLVAAIDQTDQSIIGNKTTLLMRKTYLPALDTPQTFSINFGNPIVSDDGGTSRPLTNDLTVYSSGFTYNGRFAQIGEDGAGNLFIYRPTLTGREILKPSTGQVDYGRGIIFINQLTISDYTGDGIQFFARPASDDITVNQNTVLNIDATNSQIMVDAL